MLGVVGTPRFHKDQMFRGLAGMARLSTVL
jgi:hypothetical protein